MFSAKNIGEAKEVAARLGAPARAGTVEEAIAFGDVVFLAVPYGAMEAIGRDHGAALKGKIVLDCGNAVSGRDGAIADVADRDGIGITSQRFLPGARLVRVFNTIGYTIIASEAGRPEPRNRLRRHRPPPLRIPPQTRRRAARPMRQGPALLRRRTRSTASCRARSRRATTTGS
jgi:hypothetical protein